MVHLLIHVDTTRGHLPKFLCRNSNLRIEFGFSESEVRKLRVLLLSTPDALLLFAVSTLSNPHVCMVRHGYTKDFHFLRQLKSQSSHLRTHIYSVFNLLIPMLHSTKTCNWENQRKWSSARNSYSGNSGQFP